ncbi:MAG: L-aspartate--glyoxylate aminotransferase BhcA [Pseudomonadota bacterium]
MNTPNPVFIPGPTNIPDELRRAIDVQTIDHRSSAFGELLHPTLEGVKRIFKTKTGTAFILPTTGTGAWETAITNTLSPGDKVLVSRYGVFSHKWIDLCERHGLDVMVVEQGWGLGAPADTFAEILAADRSHEIKAVLVTHNETATGVRSNIRQVRQAIDASNHPAMLYVDGVSSIGSMDFRMDEWGVDIAITGSQKGFMLPPGLGILCLSEKALVTTKTAKLSRCFFDLGDMATNYEIGGYPYTPPVALIKGLSHAIGMLEAETLPAVFARHYRIAEGVRRAVSAWGFDLCAKDSHLYSDTVSTILLPESVDGNAVVAHAADAYQVAFGAGLGQLAGKAFRIGHLGQLTDVMALSGIATAEMVLSDMGASIQMGSGVAAAQEFYRSSHAANARMKRAA